jgi:hypothetical protein
VLLPEKAVLDTLRDKLMKSSIENMIKYCSGIADEFEARLNRIRHYVPDHYLTSGTANEIILRDFLSTLTSGKYEVGQGFICDPTRPDSVSKQCDILVYDRHTYPLVYSEGEVKVVFPQSVRILIEVKTRLDKTRLAEALENIRVAREMNFQINGVVFSYEGTSVDTVVRNLQRYHQELPAKTAPIAILLLDKGAIIHSWPGTLTGGGDTYEARVSKANDTGVVVAFLLLLLYDAELLGVFGGASVAKMMREFLEETTTRVSNSIRIGSLSMDT